MSTPFPLREGPEMPMRNGTEGNHSAEGCRSFCFFVGYGTISTICYLYITPEVMESRSRIARGRRSNTDLVCLYTAIDSLITALALTLHRVTNIFCPGMTAERRNWIYVTHLFILRIFTLIQSRNQLSVR